MTSWKSKCGMMELRLGDYREVLADVEADHCITDPPYGGRTHKGSDDLPGNRRAISYDHWTPRHVDEFCTWTELAVRGWVCAMTSDDLIEPYRTEAKARGRYDFAPVPILANRVRVVGDGPASSAVYLMPSRPRERRFMKWGALPGFYFARVERDGHIGGKPLALMRTLVCDYSRPGDLIVDPCAGGGTTLLAAAIEGRRAIGAEIDPETYHKAVERLSRPYTPVVRFEALTGTQGEML